MPARLIKAAYNVMLFGGVFQRWDIELKGSSPLLTLLLRLADLKLLHVL